MDTTGLGYIHPNLKGGGVTLIGGYGDEQQLTATLGIDVILVIPSVPCALAGIGRLGKHSIEAIGYLL